MSTTRDAAREIVAELAARLADPVEVVAATTAGGPTVHYSQSETSEVWEPLSLNNGYPAIALLYAELSHCDPRLRAVTHRYLQAAGAHVPRSGTHGLFGGLGSLAIAISAAKWSESDYATLDDLQNTLVGYALGVVHHEHRRINASEARTTFPAYDAINGLAGLGRYLLCGTQTRCHPAVGEILGYLVRLSQPLTVAGIQAPGWWVGHSPTMDDNPAYPSGHANIGLAHGIPGPLATLALAWRSGHQVPGQEQAMATMAEWLMDQRRKDEAGTYWPRTAPDYEGTAERPSWCYGTPGIARALQLAGLALDRPDWLHASHDAVRALTQRTTYLYALNSGLCHGWAGLLQALWRLNEEFHDDVVARFMDTIAQELMTRYDPSRPFGFPVPYAGTHYDFPGFLDGAAGVALALHTYGTNAAPNTNWDATLLLI